MKKIIIVLILLSFQKIHAQDSLSTVFAKIYNEYRIQNNLSTLVYGMELDSVAMIRLVESSQGVDDCFTDPFTGGICEDGIRDLHFKFNTRANDFNQKNNKIEIINENMLLFPEFTSPKILVETASNGIYIPKKDTINIKHKNGMIEKNIAENSLKSWIESNKHKVNLLMKNGTRFAFKTFRTMHNNYQWLHVVFLMGTDKN